MPYLIFLCVLLGGAAAIVFGQRFMGPKRGGPEIRMIRLATANYDTELQIWLAALRSAGLKYRVQTDGEPYPYGMPPPYSKELWVKESDYEEARRVLGLPSSG